MLNADHMRTLLLIVDHMDSAVMVAKSAIAQRPKDESKLPTNSTSITYEPSCGQEHFAFTKTHDDFVDSVNSPSNLPALTSASFTLKTPIHEPALSGTMEAEHVIPDENLVAVLESMTPDTIKLLLDRIDKTLTQDVVGGIHLLVRTVRRLRQSQETQERKFQAAIENADRQGEEADALKQQRGALLKEKDTLEKAIVQLKSEARQLQVYKIEYERIKARPEQQLSKEKETPVTRETQLQEEHIPDGFALHNAEVERLNNEVQELQSVIRHLWHYHRVTRRKTMKPQYNRLRKGLQPRTPRRLQVAPYVRRRPRLRDDEEAPFSRLSRADLQKQLLAALQRISVLESQEKDATQAARRLQTLQQTVNQQRKEHETQTNTLRRHVEELQAQTQALQGQLADSVNSNHKITSLTSQLNSKDILIKGLRQSLHEREALLKRKTQQTSVLLNALRNLRGISMNSDMLESDLNPSDFSPLPGSSSNKLLLDHTAMEPSTSPRQTSAEPLPSTGIATPASSASTLTNVHPQSVKRVERTLRAKMDEQRDIFLMRIHKIQAQLLEAERELKVLRSIVPEDETRRSFQGSRDFSMRPTSPEDAVGVGTSPRVQKSLMHKDPLASPGVRPERSNLLNVPGVSLQTPLHAVEPIQVVVPGASATVRVPAQAHHGDVVLHIDFPPTHLKVNPTTRLWTIEERKINRAEDTRDCTLCADQYSVWMATLDTSQFSL